MPSELQKEKLVLHHQVELLKLEILEIVGRGAVNFILFLTSIFVEWQILM